MTRCIGTGFKITFIGAGNVAWHLARAAHEAGNEIVQVYSRRLEPAQALAEAVCARATCVCREIEPGADVYVYALKDDVLPEVIREVRVDTGLHVHTSGSVPMSVFEGEKREYGCMYPLQTFTKQKVVDVRRVPFFVEANSEAGRGTVRAVAGSMAERVYELSSEDRQALHIAGVFACNFTNLMYVKAEEILRGKGLTFDVMEGLIAEQVEKAVMIGPREAQTGPAARGDRRIIEKQMALLADEPRWQEVYRLLTELILSDRKQ